MSKKKMTKKEMFKELRVLFYGWEIILIMLALFAIHYLFYVFVSKNVLFSIAIGVIGVLFFFKFFIYPNRKLKRHQRHLSELLKYVTNMTFFLQTGDNVLHALKSVRTSVHKDIQRDIDRTIKVLEEEAVLDTSHFEKYDFPTLNQFHNNLMIKYERGGNTSELFGHIQRNMIFELQKRDELYKRRRSFALNVYVVLGMVFSMTLTLRLVAPELWDVFLSIPIAPLATMGITYLLLLLNLYLLQKHNLDISVRL